MIYPIKIIELSGLFNANKGNELIGQIKDITHAKEVEILLIDMNNVKFIDSSGLGALVKAMQILNKANTQLFVCSLNEQVRVLFEMTNMDRIFQILKDREQFQQEILPPFLQKSNSYIWNQGSHKTTRTK